MHISSLLTSVEHFYFWSEMNCLYPECQWCQWHKPLGFIYHVYTSLILRLVSLWKIPLTSKSLGSGLQTEILIGMLVVCTTGIPLNLSSSPSYTLHSCTHHKKFLTPFFFLLVNFLFYYCLHLILNNVKSETKWKWLRMKFLQK